jgi:hypothetical protein
MYVPFSVVKSIHEQTHSAMPNAPVVPHSQSRRRPSRAVRRLLRRPATVPVSVTKPAPVAETLPKLALVVAESAGELCEAEVRDRGTKTASAPRAR